MNKNNCLPLAACCCASLFWGIPRFLRFVKFGANLKLSTLGFLGRPQSSLRNGVLKSLSFMFEYIGEMSKDGRSPQKRLHGLPDWTRFWAGDGFTSMAGYGRVCGKTKQPMPEQPLLWLRVKDILAASDYRSVRNGRQPFTHGTYHQGKNLMRVLFGNYPRRLFRFKGTV